ncbi:MAG TPA: hypothetical protein VMS93_02210 [Candidatus Saccharimonadales bacterium]|nr:hypothetical protein [Candidatus Saccharimonadales bacterium]
MLSRKLVLMGILVTACVGLAVVGCGDNNSIVRPPVDEQPLPAPQGFTAAMNTTTAELTFSWLPSSNSTVRGYEVFMYAPSPSREDAYVKLTPSPVNGTSITRYNLQDGGDFILKAVSSTGLEGLATHAVHVDPYSPPPDIPVRLH